MVSHGGYQRFNWHVEGFADPQKRKDSDGPTGFHHLPVTYAEPVGNHVLLTEFTREAAGPDFVSETAKETAIVSR